MTILTAVYYWYEYWHTECVLCGKESVLKERVSCKERPKPQKYEDRHHFKQDACSQHFI